MLTCYVGPMFGGKTTRLLSALRAAANESRRVELYKPQIDVRYGADVVSHDGDCRPCTSVTAAEQIEPEPGGVVGIDEAFMIPGIAARVRELLLRDTTVFVSSLLCDEYQQVFPTMAALVPLASRVEVCAARCEVCASPALHIKRVAPYDGRWVGGKELYEPRCFVHHSC